MRQDRAVFFVLFGLSNKWTTLQRSSLVINALRACVYIHMRQLSSFRAPTLWFIRSDCRYLPYSRHLSEFMPISFTRKRTKHENTRSTKMAADGY